MTWPQGAVSYFIENNADFDITYTFNDIDSINTLAPSEGAFVDATATTTDGFPLDGASGTVSWNIGTVNTASENDSATTAINPQIIINYFARINNDTLTDAGDSLQNTATLAYENGETAATENLTDNTPQITAIEPLLTLGKTVNNITQPGLDPDAGDVLEYVITIENIGDSIAYDTNIVDTIAAGTSLDGSFTPTATIDTVAVTGFVATPAGGPTGPLIWGRNNADETLDIPGSNSVLLLTYRVTVADSVEPLQPLNNSVVIDWTSLDGSSAQIDARERTGGADCSVIVVPNDYCTGPVIATQTVANNNNIIKAYVSDTFAPTNDTNLRIGDQVQYTLTLNLQEGTTTNIQLQDDLPNGMEFVGVVSINGDTGTGVSPNVSYSDASAPFTYVGDNVIQESDIVVTTGSGTNTITFNIGDVIADPDNLTNNNFTIIYTAQVVDGELPIPQNPSTTLTNIVDFNFNDINNVTVTQTSSASIVAMQPQFLLADVNKLRFDSGYSLSIPSGSPAPSASIVYFRLQACNSGNAPAYDMVLLDELDPDLTITGELVPASITGVNNGAGIPDVFINGALATQGVDYSYSLSGSLMTFSLTGDTAIPASSDPNNCLIIEYNVQVDPTLGGGNSWDNSLLLDRYASLPNPGSEPAALVAERQVYGTDIGPALLNMHNINPIENPSKTFVGISRPDINPAPLTARDATLAAVGEWVTYQIIVPDTGMNGTLHDVLIVDDMDASMEFVSASLVVSSSTDYGFEINETIDTSLSSGNQVRISLDQPLIALDRITVNVVARVANNASASIATSAFGNSVRFEFANSPGGTVILGGTASTLPANNISIVEPQLDTTTNLATKTVVNLTKALPDVDAGDVLEYTITYSFLGGASGDQYSDAYDISIIDTLGAGLEFNPGSATTSIGTIANPGIVGQVLSFDIANGTDIDVPEGTVNATITYQAIVQDAALANQTLSNSAVIQWSSLDDNISDVDEAFERNGTGGVNDYFSTALVSNVTTTDTNTVVKDRLSDTSPALTAVSDVRIGDIVDYRIRLSLQEGTSNTVTITDVLPQGLQFEGIISINGVTAAPYSNVAPFTHAAIAAGSVVVTGDPVTGPTTATWTLGNITNEGNTGVNDGNNDFDIIYRTRVLNLVQTPLDNPASNIALTNSLSFDYVTATGSAPTATDVETINIKQPNLSVNKTLTTEFGDLVIAAAEKINYVVTITNSASATSPAYDVRLEDTLPVGLREGGVTVISTQLPAGNSVANLAPVYNATTGLAVWDFDTGTADAYTILPGQELIIEYQVEADAGIGAGKSGLVNSAVVPVYHSFDDEAVPFDGSVTGVREIYGPTNIAVASPLSTPSASPMEKANPSSLTQSIGMPFSYTIRIPETPQATALFDVQITDDLASLSPNVDLAFVSVQKISTTGSWVPVNTGTSTNLLIQDVTNGIDVPAGEQAEIEITVVLRNSSNNQAGDTFINIASYSYNSADNLDTSRIVGGSDSDVALTIVAPTSMIMQKTGPASMEFGLPDTFTLDVQNTGTGPAYDITITDNLPNPAAGGMCDTAPTNVTARVYQSDGTTPVSIPLIENTHFVTSFTGSPTCTLSVTMTAPEAELLPLNRLIVTFDSQIDADNSYQSSLTNVAGATRWFSNDTPAGVVTGEIRQYDETFNTTDLGTPAIVDHEDSHVFTIDAPELSIVKSVTFPSGGNADFADSGDLLRYTISITNTGNVDANNFNLLDEPDALNMPTGYFVSGSMIVTSIEPGSTDNTNINAGANGAGRFDISNITVPVNATSSFVFDVQLKSNLDVGTVVLNQASVSLTGFADQLSDKDDDTALIEPTKTVIGTKSTFDLQKTSADITGDTNVLEAGDILRYTITAKNISVEDSINTILRDQVPANTSYVANSTTLNGNAVADPSPGVSPLQDGILINAPENTTPGAMRADSTNTLLNVATINFSVMVNADVINGAIISNQAFVGGNGVITGAFPEQPSDDPDTDIVGDPTRDVVGNRAIIDAQKTVEVVNDTNVLGSVDEGDRLRYTIVVSNYGAISATGVTVTDSLPQVVSSSLDAATYVSSSTTLNGTAVADGAGLPTAIGLLVNSPGAAAGTVEAMKSAILIFDVLVNNNVSDGDVISNQADIESNEYPLELSDEDGNDLNGDQPTQIIAGKITQNLSIDKQVFIVGGGTAQPGKVLEYVISVENTGTTAIDLSTTGTDVLKIYDDIDQLNLLSYVVNSVRVDGVAYDESIATPEVSFVSPRLIVNYDEIKKASFSNYQFEPGDRLTIRYQATIDNVAQQGTTISNTAAIDWGNADFSGGSLLCPSGNVDACATVQLDVGGAPGVANVSGNVWHDVNFDVVNDPSEINLENWQVEIYFGAGTVNTGDYLDTVFTDVNGNYSLNGLIPVEGDAKKYAIRFRQPGATALSASLGTVDIEPSVVAVVEPGESILSSLDVANNSHTSNVNLPIQPNGVVYDSLVRRAVPGAILTLVKNSGELNSDCFDDVQQQGQMTTANGYYKFELNTTGTDCALAANDGYRISVTPPDGYFDDDDNVATPVVSRIIPPAIPVADPAYDAITCAGDAVGSTSQCEVQNFEVNPGAGIAPGDPGADYYLKFIFDQATVNDQIYNNHIPIDPELNDAVSISKTSPMVNVNRSQLVPYTITLTNNFEERLNDLNILDIFPPGFKYVSGSGRIQTDGETWDKIEPVYIQGITGVPASTEIELLATPANQINDANDLETHGRVLAWNNIGGMAPNSVVTLKLLLVVGSGVGEGEYVNRAVVSSDLTGGAASRVAQSTVRVVPDPTFDCSDIIGKVFDDKNLNAYQDEGEPGIAGARVLTAKGLELVTDQYGRFHLTCAVVPNRDRGSNFIIKLDERSLPGGYRLTTENPRVLRATRGKMLKFNFGAAIHKVIRLDMADPVFEPGTTTMRPQWVPRLDLLMTELAKDPSILRLSYLAENETESEVNERLDIVKKEITQRWKDLNCCYELRIETDVFWRKGGPVDRGEFDE